MISIPVPSVILLTLTIAAAAFGVGYVVAMKSAGDPNSDPFKYCFHVNTNESFVHQYIGWAPPGEYAVCKVG